MQTASFFRQLATLIASGISIAQSLALAGRNGPKLFQRQLRQMARQVESGQSLATAMGSATRYFDPWTRQVIAIAESSGLLTTGCTLLAQAHDLRQKRLRFYRLIQAFVMAIVGLSSLVFSLTHYGLAGLWNLGLWVALLLGLGLVAIANQPATLPAFARGVATCVRPLPGLQLIVEAHGLIAFGFMALPLQAGLSPVQALELVAPIIVDPHLAKGISVATQQVKRGRRISKSLTPYLPTIAYQMLQTGEETGCLDTMLTKIQETYAEDLNRYLQKLQIILQLSTLGMMAILILVLGTQVFGQIQQILSAVRSTAI